MFRNSLFSSRKHRILTRMAWLSVNIQEHVLIIILQSRSFQRVPEEESRTLSLKLWEICFTSREGCLFSAYYITTPATCHWCLRGLLWIIQIQQAGAQPFPKIELIEAIAKWSVCIWNSSPGCWYRTTCKFSIFIGGKPLRAVAVRAANVRRGNGQRSSWSHAVDDVR